MRVIVPNDGARRHWITLGLLALLALTFAARAVPAYRHVFRSDGEVRLLGADSYYHLRHARFAAHEFPHLMRWDVGTHYPAGQIATVPGLFDLSIGGVAWAAGFGDPSDRTVARVAAWAPVFIALAAIVALFVLVRELSGPRSALIACALLTLYPGEFRDRSLLGAVDHHVAEVMFLLWSAVALTRLLRSPEPSLDGGDAATRFGSAREWRAALGAALPLALFQFAWNGAPMHIVLVGCALLVALGIGLARGEETGVFVHRLARYGAALAALVGALGLIWPDLVMLPRIQRWIPAAALGLSLAVVAQSAGVQALVRRGLAPKLSVLVNWSALAATLVATFAVAGSFSPAVARVFEAKTELVLEHVAVSWSELGAVYGLPGVLALSAALVGCLRVLGLYFTRTRTGAGDWCPQRAFALVVAIEVAVLSARTNDYGYTLAPWVALCATLALTRAFGWIDRSGRALRIASVTVVGLAIALPALLPGRIHAPWPNADEVEGALLLDDGWAETLAWLEASTPAPSLSVDARVGEWDRKPGGFEFPAGTYGVLSAWDFGNFVAALGRRTAVRSQSPSARTAAWFVSADTEGAFERLNAFCTGAEEVRYVILDARTLGEFFLGKAATAGIERDHLRVVRGTHAPTSSVLFSFGPAYRDSIAARLYLDDARSLAQFRLVYESSQQSFLTYRTWRERDGSAAFARESYRVDSEQDRSMFANLIDEGVAATERGLFYEGEIHSSVKVFEAVRGARLTGSVAPGALVRAQVSLFAAATGRSIEVSYVTEANELGRFELQVPYATEGNTKTGVVTRGGYRLQVVEENRTVFATEVSVTESEVRSGATIELSSPLPSKTD